MKLRIAFVALAALGLSLSGCSSSAKASTTTTAPASTALANVKSFSGLTQNHTKDPVRYPQTPPVGGDHNPRWQNCGFYGQPIVTEKGVHSMEHGAVWITFKPDLAPADIAKIKTLTNATAYVLASPFEGLPAPVVASAWGKQLVLTGVDDPGLAAFVKKYANSPDAPEPGALCSGADGIPEQ